MSEFYEPPRSATPWIDLASRALALARRDMHETAARVVERIAREYGEETIPQTMLAWIDTTLVQAGLDVARPDLQPIGLGFEQLETGTRSGADAVPPHVAWAGRLITARANNDEQQYRALIESVPTDHDWGSRVMAVLTMCALNINRGVESTGANR